MPSLASNISIVGSATDRRLRHLATLLAPLIVAGLREESAPPAQPLRRLTVVEFAHCVQRSVEHVRRQIRARVIAREHIDGPPYLISPGALAKFGVTREQARERLAQLRAATPPLAESPQPLAA